MSAKPSILIVDDSLENRLLLTMMLEDDYQVHQVESGEACLSFIEETIPDLILLDVDMPGLNGYQVCQKLRTNFETEHLPIIFVSALDSTEERLAGFEAGGDEYVIKPIDGEDLFAKIKTCLKRHNENKASEEQAQQAMKVAMEAMTVSSELGQIVEFIKKGQEINTTDDIGNAVLSLSKEFGLSASVMITTDQTYFYGCTPDSMEANFLQKVANANERIISMGIRTIVNNDNIVLLIKNIPIDDENKAGRLRDHLAVIMDIATGFVDNLNSALKQKQAQIELLDTIIGLTKQQINKTAKAIKQQQQKTNAITQNMVDDLEQMLFGLGLDNDQEKLLMALASKTSDELYQTFHNIESIEQQLSPIVAGLEKFKDQNLS